MGPPQAIDLALDMALSNPSRVPALARAQKKDPASSLGLVFAVRAPRSGEGVGAMFKARSIVESNNKK